MFLEWVVPLVRVLRARRRASFVHPVDHSMRHGHRSRQLDSQGRLKHQRDEQCNLREPAEHRCSLHRSHRPHPAKHLGCVTATRHAVGMYVRVGVVKLMSSMCPVLALAVALCAPCLAQSPYPDLPTHAHFSATDQGWTCNDGFKQAAGYCMAEGDVPSQGPFEMYDGQWRCRAGYKRDGAFCVTPSAPEHATLTEPGGRWECDWGYRRVGNRCDEISPPPHAYLDAAGHDWVCYPGFEKNSDKCVTAPQGESAESKPR
jgi:hypothetical protein